MSVTLTDEQYGIMYHALGEIAAGYFVNQNGHQQRLSRTMCFSKAREAFTAMGYKWQQYPDKRPPETPG